MAGQVQASTADPKVVDDIKARFQKMFGDMKEANIIGEVKMEDNEKLLIFQCKGGEGRSWEFCAYVRGTEFEVYTRIEELTRSIINNTKKGRSYLIQEIVNVGGVAGLIGLVITITICYAFIQDSNVKIPEVLTNALIAIIGFYFGSQVKKSEK